MELKLLKPIVFFDLETTGINIGNDRIVEISMLKIFPNGNKESKTWLGESRNRNSSRSQCNSWDYQ